MRKTTTWFEKKMWDLNDSPRQQKDEESYGYSSRKTSLDHDDDKGTRVGSSEEVGAEKRLNLEKRISKIFGGYSLGYVGPTQETGSPVTRHFFPVYDQDCEMAAISSGGKFWQSEPPGAGSYVDVSQPLKKSRRGPKPRSSQYRGVSFYKRTGRWESHIWDGKQVYLGGYDTSLAAARAYDRAAIKFRGLEADINFSIEDYEEDLKQMSNLTKEEFVHVLRQQSTDFPRRSSKYRGVTLFKCGRWEARMSQFIPKKAFDRATLKCYGKDTVTNFDLSLYEDELKASGHGADHDLDLSLGSSASKQSSIIDFANRRQNIGMDHHIITALPFDANWDNRGVRPKQESFRSDYDVQRRYGYRETETLQLLAQSHLQSPASSSLKSIEMQSYDQYRRRGE